MKNIIFKITAAALISFPSLTAASGAYSDMEYFGIGTSKLETSVKETAEAPDLVRLPLDGLNKSAAAGGIVNTGMQAWSVINSGQPSGSHSSAYASAVPGFGQWANFSGWKKKEITYHYTVTNLMHVDVIRVKYVVSFYYSGKDQRPEIPSGKDPFSGGVRNYTGSYITNFTVRPVEVDIKWGFNYSLGITMSDPMNIATSDDPVAYLQADLNWNVSTVFYSKGGIYTYGVDGLGNYTDLTEKSSALTRELPVPALEKPASVSWH